MDTKIQRELGSGVNGTVYLAKIGRKTCVSKIEKYDGDTSTASPFIRQLQFDKDVCSKYPTRFMTLHSYSIVLDCDHKQKIPEGFPMPPSMLKRLNDKNNESACCILNYTPALAYTLRQVRPKLTAAQLLAVYTYLRQSIAIMQKHGYTHRDLHDRNIMCDKSMKKWYIIDYGLVYKKDFVKTEMDKFISNDYISLIWECIQSPVYNWLVANNKKLPPYNVFLERVRGDERYKKFKKYDTKYARDRDAFALIIALIDYSLYIKGIDYDETPVGKRCIKYVVPNREVYLRHVLKQIC